jgi:hypothetical protein
MKTSIPPVLITIALVCFGLLPKGHGVLPPPDGGYPGFNTAEGTKALQSLTTGSANTAVGWYSLFSNAEGSFNTAVGAGSLDLNTADSNTATGAAALLFNTTGAENTANGTAALELNETGSQNTANGAFALFNNTEGNLNTANGDSALFNNTTGYQNTANGAFALFSNQDGASNTATGLNALKFNISGFGNTAVGHNTLANTTGGGNIALGLDAGTDLTTGNNNIDIGNVGDASDSDTIRIGNSTHGRIFIPAINNIVLGAGVPVTIDSTTGLLGEATSSRRFKENIKPMDNASEAILALKPVTFHYKKEIDSQGVPQFGLVAEEVEKVNPDLVVRDKEGKPYSVRYDQVNAMLLNEFLKEHRKNQEQEAAIAKLKKELQANTAQQQKQIEALTAGLQKVSAQLELRKPAPQTVLNSQ